MKKVAIVGGTGYTGVELLRLLMDHPEIEVSYVTSRENAGMRLDEMFPNLRGHIDLTFSAPEDRQLADCDLVFFATPHGVAMRSAPTLLAAGTKIVDLSADFRLKHIATWQAWYGMEHTCPEWVEQAVYGLPELNRDAITQAKLVANPGCYPTAITLGLMPLLEQQLIDVESIIADSKSAVSGAGRKASVATLLCEASDNFKAYGVAGHRHLPEIAQTLSLMAGQTIDLTFVPHLLPMIRGIHATLYANCLNADACDLTQLQALYEQRYQHEAFVDILPQGTHPETRSVRGSNLCRIALHRPQTGKRVVILSVIDNLVKGAAGQAIQNMNIMFGFKESLGLERPALLP